MAKDVRHIDEAKEKAKQAAEATGKAVQERLQTAREKFSEVADSLGKGAGSATTRVKEKADQATAKVKERADQATAKVKEKADQVSTVARERYGVAAERARQGYDKARKDLDHLTQDVNEYVRDNPGKSVLIAAGVGFLIGLIFRGRGRD
jgi:ElaB/YqjD/DUF883 family membrane-anchored ribosome-binding protein